jgi:hypothetical protein
MVYVYIQKKIDNRKTAHFTIFVIQYTQFIS